MSRINDLTAHPGVRDGTLLPVLLEWVGQSAPPLNLLLRKAIARQPRIRAFVEFLVEEADRLDSQRLPRGLPPVQPSKPPDWFRRRSV